MEDLLLYSPATDFTLRDAASVQLSPATATAVLNMEKPLTPRSTPPLGPKLRASCDACGEAKVRGEKSIAKAVDGRSSAARAMIGVLTRLS
jgi:hypothetical protein